MNEKNLMQKIFEASNMINNKSRNSNADYISHLEPFFRTKSRINKIKLILNKING